MSSSNLDLNSAGNSALTSSSTSKQSFEIQESFPFYEGHPQVFAKIDKLLAETYEEVPSTVSSVACQSSGESDEDVPWYRQQDILVLDDCITVQPVPRKPSHAPELAAIDEFDEETVEEECEVFPNFDIPRLEAMVPLPIPGDLVKDVCFTETLLICQKDPTDASETLDLHVVGSTIIQVKDGGFDKFEVFATSSLTSWDETKLTSEIFGVTNRSLLGGHETKSETSQKPDEVQSEKTLILDPCADNGYFLKSSDIKGQSQHLKRGLLKLPESGDFVFDSGNIVLLRYLIRTNFIGSFETWTVDINGNVLRAVYSISDFQPLTVAEGGCVDVKQVVRAFQGKEGSGYHAVSYYTSGGNLIRHMWSECDYFLAVNPLSELLTDTGSTTKPEGTDWQDDPRLFLDYMDHKAQKVMTHKNYIRFNETLVDLLKQYVLRLVHQQPTEIVDFSLQHFQGTRESKRVSFVGADQNCDGE